MLATKDPLTKLIANACEAEMKEKRKHIKRDSLERRTDRVKKREKAEMLRLHLSGLTPQEIAAKLDRKVDTVKRHLTAKSKEEALQQVEIRRIPREFFIQIQKLAKKLEQLTRVPEPRRAFPRDDMEFLPEDKEEIMKGDTSPLLSSFIAMITPWWTPTGPVDIRLYLTFEEEALLNHFTGLPSNQKLKAALVNWEEKVNTYIQLKRSNADAEEIRSAYLEAHDAEIAFHSGLWAAVETLRWGF